MSRLLAYITIVIFVICWTSAQAGQIGPGGGTNVPLPVGTNNGGTGTGATLSGVVRGGNPMTASELSGDVTTSGSNAAQVKGLHFGSTGIPTTSTPPTSGQCLVYNGVGFTGTGCNGGGGSGTVTTGTQGFRAYYPSSTTTVSSVGNTLVCDAFPLGNDLGVQIQNCINAIPSDGGVADATDLGGVLNTRVIINGANDADEGITLRLGHDNNNNQIACTINAPSFNVSSISVASGGSPLTAFPNVATLTTSVPMGTTGAQSSIVIGEGITLANPSTPFLGDGGINNVDIKVQSRPTTSTLTFWTNVAANSYTATSLHPSNCFIVNEGGHLEGLGAGPAGFATTLKAGAGQTGALVHIVSAGGDHDNSQWATIREMGLDCSTGSPAVSTCDEPLWFEGCGQNGWARDLNVRYGTNAGVLIDGTQADCGGFQNIISQHNGAVGGVHNGTSYGFKLDGSIESFGVSSKLRFINVGGDDNKGVLDLENNVDLVLSVDGLKAEENSLSGTLDPAIEINILNGHPLKMELNNIRVVGANDGTGTCNSAGQGNSFSPGSSCNVIKIDKGNVIVNWQGLANTWWQNFLTDNTTGAGVSPSPFIIPLSQAPDRGCYSQSISGCQENFAGSPTAGLVGIQNTSIGAHYGSLTVNTPTTPGQPNVTQQGTTGSSTVSYACGIQDRAGNRYTASAFTQITNANATPSTTNPVQILCAQSPNAYAYNIYKANNTTLLATTYTGTPSPDVPFGNGGYAWDYGQATSTVSAPIPLSQVKSDLLAVNKQSGAPVTAAGAGLCQMFVTAGTGGGTCAIKAICGTSTTPITLADNVGGGC